MSRFGKLAAVVALVLGGMAVEAQASPMLEPAFIVHFANKQSEGHWRGDARFHRFFINWRPADTHAPAWNVANITWVQAHMGRSGYLLSEPGKMPENVRELVLNNRPAWRNTIPEPASALLVGGCFGLMALRRRSA